MERLSDTGVLKFKFDTLEAVRRDVNLDQAGRMADALDILENWVKMQTHFNKKNFPRDYYERTLIMAKGLVERAKERLDKLCTFRTLMPEFFSVSDPKKEFLPLQNVILDAHLPTLSSEHYRVYVGKVVSDENLNSSTLLSFYKFLIMRCEYFKQFEYCAGIVIILDFTDVNILNTVMKINPVEMRQMVTVMTDGYGLRIKSIHLITSSKMVDAMVSLLKQVFSEKLGGRIRTHKNIESVYGFVDKEVLPADFGGEEKLLKELHEAWVDAVSSKEFVDYLDVMKNANTNEIYRQADKFNEDYMGTPGSFRNLNVD